jgi:hypothetical protein
LTIGSCVGSGKPGKCSMRDARAVTFPPFPVGWEWEWEEALGSSVGWRG